ncbi:DUF6378 domain-containing protein [Saccharopolyspora pogona]|uniref:DUF6378 domain-containing protein n=1 Tax=Saccharopolyspora pogona TaxID=333966 RepID=UPI001CC2335D|nr:DUF6378 domain-containing protein [Saccharopolyspora pogona]
MTENDLGMLEEAAVDSTPRSGLLREAERLITGDRNVTHGEPTANFRDIAELWTTLLSHKLAPGQRITSGDTAMLMVALKLARMRAKPTRDHWVDIAGYAACGFETDVAEGRIKESAE